MRHFNYHENGGPFPSSCLSCGNNKQLFDLGRELLSGGSAQLCMNCLKELSSFNGWAEEAPYEQAVAEAMQRIADLEAQLNLVPDHVEELINGIRSSVTDFVFAVSYSNSADSLEDVSDVDGIVDEPSGDGETAGEVSPAPVKSSRK